MRKPGSRRGSCRAWSLSAMAPHNVPPKHGARMATSGLLGEVAPVDLEALKKVDPEAFGRPYGQASGLRFERVLAREEG